MDIFSLIIGLAILLFSVVFHEVAHGLVAEKLGDSTARYAGRLTLNPIPHIDLYGSIILPAFLLFVTQGQFVLGSAKPVPVNFYNLRNYRRDMALVSLAGPATNLLLAFVAGGVAMFLPGISSGAENLLLRTVWLNLILMVFNLIPIPPLDGSKVLASILGYINPNLMHNFVALERYGLVFIILFLVLFAGTGLFNIIFLPAILLFQLFTGTIIPPSIF
jgi:Zn-dependent protease